MNRVIVFSLIAAIVVAHVFLWRSGMAPQAKLAFTLINAVAWTIVLAPIFLVDRWLEAVKQRNEGAQDGKNPDCGQQSGRDQ